jgi:hypothetical protein
MRGEKWIDGILNVASWTGGVVLFGLVATCYFAR